jgi:hypothetical protein
MFNDSPRLSRRDWGKLCTLGVLGGSLSGWFGGLAQAAAPNPARKKQVILLWMPGGPSQIDTFDLKPRHPNGGPFKEIDTAVPDIRISEHLPKVAHFTNKMAIIRSMTSKEGDHTRATFLMRTGYLPQASVAYPSLGALVARELGSDQLTLPPFVSIAPFRFFNLEAYGSGFLGPKYAPLIIADMMVGSGASEEALKVKDLEPARKLPAGHAASRIDLLRDLENDFCASRPDLPPRSHKAAYERAVRLMNSPARKAFLLDEEKSHIHDTYGRNLFGQGCLLARRLIEQGVPFVEVSLGGGSGFAWDTHQDNFAQVKQLSGVLDQGWSTLMNDLKERGLLDSTLIVWMGEFGRTPKINGSNGRDHYPNAWSAVLAGGGIQGGQVLGQTSKDGTTVEKRPVSVPDLMATIWKVLGIDPEKQNMAGGRPIRLVDKGGKPIKEITG